MLIPVLHLALNSRLSSQWKVSSGRHGSNNFLQMNFIDDVSEKSVGKMADFETLTLYISL